jgi:hypothetical protein
MIGGAFSVLPMVRAKSENTCRGPVTIKCQSLMVLSRRLEGSRLFGGTAETRASIARQLTRRDGGARDQVVTVVHGVRYANTLWPK